MSESGSHDQFEEYSSSLFSFLFFYWLIKWNEKEKATRYVRFANWLQQLANDRSRRRQIRSAPPLRRVTFYITCPFSFLFPAQRRESERRRWHSAVAGKTIRNTILTRFASFCFVFWLLLHWTKEGIRRGIASHPVPRPLCCITTATTERMLSRKRFTSSRPSFTIVVVVVVWGSTYYSSLSNAPSDCCCCCCRSSFRCSTDDANELKKILERTTNPSLYFQEHRLLVNMRLLISPESLNWNRRFNH